MAEKTNIIVVISDTLRTAYLGCYGNPDIHTPNIDAFAKRAMRFTRAYPESLPTIPVRRALHTGRRSYPFNDYRPVKWDMVYLPGWQAMDNDEDTLAEDLAHAGYQTGFVTDTAPYFTPAFNFQRGFWQWEYIRGQVHDRWKSPHTVPKERYAQQPGEHDWQEDTHGLFPMHLANTAAIKSEQDTTTAQCFEWGMDFLEDNRSVPFYLLIDCFDPHEMWSAPEKYARLYCDPNYDGRTILHCQYGPAQEFGYTDEEITNLKGHYCGLVTLVDAWFGKLMQKLDDLGLAANTAIFFLSDHGTNFCDNPRNVIGKPHDAMYPGVMNLPFLVKLPDETGADQTCDQLLYNIDLTATVYDLAAVNPSDHIDGQSLLPLIKGKGLWTSREYITCCYSHSLCYIDDKTWALANIDGKLQEMFDLETDPECQKPLDLTAVRHRFELPWQRLLHDAVGKFPDYRKEKQTDAIGQKSKAKGPVL